MSCEDPSAPFPTPEEVKETLLSAYPSKTRKKREKQITINDPLNPTEIAANTRTVPGIITQRGCTYAGCKGVVVGPIGDILHITHGPIGCGYYSWLSRRNLTRAKDHSHGKTTGTNYLQYSMSTDMQESEIVYGGEKKLALAIREAYAEFKPKAIVVYSTCPVGLIGDDVHAVCRNAKEELGINVFGLSCEGYRGVSQSAGHHIANNKVFTDIVGLDDTPPTGKYNINILGEYNIGGDAWEIHRIFDAVGINIVGVLSGAVSYDQIANCHMADLNVVMCHRSINYMAEMMETKYGLPWFKVNFVGAESTAKSLRKIAQYYGDKELIDRVEEIIAMEMREVKAALEVVKPKTQGKLAAIFVGGSRAHHYQDLFKEMGMRVISAGYEFAHRDDYEGRDVLPNIKVDADSRNIEEIEVTPDPRRYNARLTEERKAKFAAEGFAFSDYEGMMREMDKKTLVIDDISHHELEKIIEIYKPDVIGSGIKDKYIVEKMGVPCKQLHSYDYGGPYAGFKGAINFYHEIARMVSSPVWGYAAAPWERDDAPGASPAPEPVAVEA
jgi:nitrogenase molybdenum-iron protein alpha chain